MPIARSDVVAAARAELNTPWVHQGRIAGRALDCAGLVIIVARNLGSVAANFDINEYGRLPDGTLLDICERHLQRISRIELGCVIVVELEALPQHMGIVGDYRHRGWSLIHAASNARPGRVIETRLMFSRAQRRAGVYRLPGVEA
jgi:hypothetical protein